MILRSLYELAEREQLVQDPDFQSGPVSWIVRVSLGGRVTSISDAREPQPQKGKRAPKLVPKQLRIPRQAGRSGVKAPPHFFVDNAKYVFGLATADKTFSDAEGSEKSGWFRGAVAKCAAVTNDEGAQAVVSVLEYIRKAEHRLTLPEDCKSNDQFAFVYEPDVDVFVHERPAVVEYWRQVRASGGERAASDGSLCVITGEPVGTPALFPKVKKVPGGQSAGAVLVSFNKSAFESYGLAGEKNAPMSRRAAEAAATALQRLVDPAFPNPSRPDVALPPRHVRISSDTLVCYWARNAEADPFLDVLGSILEVANPEQVGELYRSIWRGRPAPVPDSGAFYALTISGAEGRLIVRDWFEASVARVSENLARHFADLEAVRNTPQTKDRSVIPQLPLRVLHASLAPFGKAEGIPDTLAAGVVRAALQGTPYPFALLSRALERARVEIGLPGRAATGLEFIQAAERNDARAMLIKAVLRRTFNKEVTPNMDPTNANPGYLCGRLMAIIERLQQLALGDVNASVVDRYFSAASATPKAVFVRLLKNSQHHARKAQDEPKTKGFAILLKRMIDEISDQFDPKNNGFPAFLRLEDQGMFVLGYHQQRHALWTKRAAEREHESLSETPIA